MMTKTDTHPPQRSGPQVQDHEALGRDDVPLLVRGRLLGFASSQSDDHQHHDGAFARPGNRCSACRWFECRIFDVAHELTTECTCTPTPQPVAKGRLWWRTELQKRINKDRSRTYTVIEAETAVEAHNQDCGVLPARNAFLVLTYGLSDVPGEVDKRRASWTDSPHEIIEFLTQRGRHDGQAFLPAASARALAQAAHWNEDINDAYVNRAVV